MLELLVKTALTAVFIVALSEIAKRAPSLAGLIVALPLATAMTMVLMHVGGEGQPKIAEFAKSTLLFLPPSTVFVIAIWAGLALGLGFWLTLGASVGATAAAFWAYAAFLSQYGLKLL